MHLPHVSHAKIRTIARVMSILLFGLWGSFFVEHLSWFGSVAENPPPVSVWILSTGHFILLVSYLVALKWEYIGSLSMTLSAIFFFSFAAGSNAFPFIIVSIFPAMLFFFCRMREKRDHRPTVVH